MDYFFTPENLLPEGVGFSLFGAEHIAWLVIAAGICVLLCVRYRRCAGGKRAAFRLALGLAIFACEIAKDLNLALHGMLNVHYLPLHLCSLAVFFTLAHALCRNETLGNFLYSTCMVGAAFALCFPDWTVYPALSYHSLVAFVVHALLVAYPLMQLCAGDFRPNARLLPRCFGILLCLALPIYVFDRVFHTNYMFLIVPPAGTPLEWFASFLGNPGYLLGYLPLIAVFWTILYLPFAKPRKNGIIQGKNSPKG